ncbi:MAG: hypothetical protein D6756_02460 [Cyanobacteria bacterium J083]|nr:MAG: hypothetical protein D6756_02460 [Cyanobacteria bacterium J083]
MDNLRLKQWLMSIRDKCQLRLSQLRVRLIILSLICLLVTVGISAKKSHLQLLAATHLSAGKNQTNYSNLPRGKISTQGSLPWLNITANQLVDGAGNPIKLRGVSLCGVGGLHPHINAPKLIQNVTNGHNGWWSTVVRIPIQPEAWQKIGEERFFTEKLAPAIRQCVKSKVYCIVDWHVVEAWDSAKFEQGVENFWSYVAPRLKNISNILFEMANEPATPEKISRENWLKWRKKAQIWVDLIRNQAPKNIIIVGSPRWSLLTAFAAKYPLQGSNLMYTAHIYPAQTKYNSEITFYHTGKAENVSLEQALEYYFGIASRHVPVFITEFGWTTDYYIDVIFGTTSEWGIPVKNYLQKQPQISWTSWVYDWQCSPKMIDENQQILGGEDYQGATIQAWLSETQGSFKP